MSIAYTVGTSGRSVVSALSNAVSDVRAGWSQAPRAVAAPQKLDRVAALEERMDRMEGLLAEIATSLKKPAKK